MDASGVGRGVVDLMAASGLKPRGVTITGGHEVTIHSSRDIRLPKTRLIGGLQIALQAYRLHVSKRIPAVPQWISEMEGFTAKVRAAGGESLEAFTSAVHDDLVIATALACWGAEHPIERPKLRML